MYFLPRFLFSSAADVLPVFDQKASSLCPEDTGPDTFFFVSSLPSESSHEKLGGQGSISSSLSGCRYRRSASRDAFGFGPFFLLTASHSSSSQRSIFKLFESSGGSDGLLHEKKLEKK